MKKANIVKLVSRGGLLTATAVLLQAAPVFLPAIGMAISPFSTLPIALAAGLNIYLGISVLLSSVLILMIVSPQEAVILLFTTGLLGAVLGALSYRKGIVVSIIAAAISLTTGILALTYIIAIPAFKGLADSFSLPVIILMYFIFSLVYVSIWNIFLRKIANHMKKTKVMDSE